MEQINNPLNVYILWHPSLNEGINYAESFFSFLSRDIRDPLSRGIGIPVYFRTGETPVEINLDEAENSAIILLVNDNMILSENWRTYVNNLHDQIKENKNHKIYPIALTNHAFKLTNKIQRINFIRLYEQKENIRLRIDFLLSRITHELCRLLYGQETVSQVTTYDIKQSSAPLKLFISHAKEDGVSLAKGLSDYLQTQTELKTFFDANDIAIGYEFSQEIEANIQKSVLVAIHSDRYSSREWCRKEIILAKKYNRPIVIINLFTYGEDRSFPYMSNLKNIRVNLEAENEEEMFKLILLSTLQETLRFKYQHLYLNYINNKFHTEIKENGILSRPPELLSLLYLNDYKNKYIVYPDPPLGDEELEIIRMFNKEMQFITPAMLPLIGNLSGEENLNEKFLKNLTIGISISEVQDISKYGFEHLHIQDALVEFTRYLYASGANLAYGGDVRYDKSFNFVEILFQLTRNHNQENKKPAEKVTNYVAYPIYLSRTTQDTINLYDVAKFIDVCPPDHLMGEFPQILKSDNCYDKYIWARSLTSMREQMNEDIDIRLIIGGKTKGYKGRYPGLVEEAYLALKSNKPIFLIGAFGGAARCIIEAIENGKTNELTACFQYNYEEYKAFANYYNRRAEDENLEKIDYDELVKFFHTKGIKSLNNGLTEDENKVLFLTTNLTEMISLVLKGLKNINK
ncbi:TIR domain-containing protein [Priestia aryabhattai]|uniref:TIR domain-containing protein n=1 Tax=Priestia aryabhattai TaxID=412384 RepID=UPI0030C9DD26